MRFAWWVVVKMPHNIHNVLSDVYDLLRMNGTAVVHTWTIERDDDQN